MKIKNADLLYPEEVHKIIGCAMKVYNTLGVGFLESVYHEALLIELENQGIECVSEKRVSVYYQGQLLSSYYQPDIICYDKIILELKSEGNGLTDADEAQLINYLKATGIFLGVLINFGKSRTLEWKRLIFTNDVYFRKNNIPNEDTVMRY